MDCGTVRPVHVLPSRAQEEAEVSNWRTRLLCLPSPEALCCHPSRQHVRCARHPPSH